MASSLMRPTSNKKRRCQVAFSYSALNDDELDLDVGEIIYGLREVEDGWWEGHKKSPEDGLAGKIGVFPSNFVKVISESDEENDENEEKDEPKAESKVKKMGFGPLVTKDALANFRNKKEVGGFGGGNAAPAAPAPGLDVKPPIPVKSPIPSPKPVRAAKKPKERLARVLFDYDAVHEDELSIREGDSIVILDTELEDPGWWKGCVRGKENKVGVFPDNFVDILEPNEDVGEINSPDISSEALLSLDKPKEQFGPSLSPKPPRPLRPVSPSGGGPSSRNSTLEREKGAADSSVPLRPDKPSHLLDKASKKLGDIFGPRTSVKKTPSSVTTVTMSEEKSAPQPVPAKPGKSSSSSGAFGSFKRKPRSGTPPSPLSCSGGSSETLDDSTESLDRSGGEGTLERTGSGRQSGGGRSSTSGCSSGGAISPTSGNPAITLDDIPVTEILPSLTAKRAIRKKGVRPPSGLFITEMGRHAAEAGRQGGVTLTSTTAAIGRTKSAENVVDASSKDDSISGDSTPDALDAPSENKKTVSPARPKPPPGAISLFPFGNPQLPAKKPSAFQETRSSADAAVSAASSSGGGPAPALPPQVKPEKKPRPPSLISSRIKNMQDSINSSSTPTSTPVETASSLPAVNLKPSTFGSTRSSNSNNVPASQSQQPQQQQQQHNQHQPLFGLRPTRPLPPKQPSPTTSTSDTPVDDSPRASSTPADEDAPSSSNYGGNGEVHNVVTISDGVVTSSSTDDGVELTSQLLPPSSHQQQQQQRDQQHPSPSLKKATTVNGFIKDSSSPSFPSSVRRRTASSEWTEDSIAGISSLEDLKKLVIAMKADMVPREEHEKLAEELKATKQQLELLTSKVERGK